MLIHNLKLPLALNYVSSSSLQMILVQLPTGSTTEHSPETISTRLPPSSRLTLPSSRSPGRFEGRKICEHTHLPHTRNWEVGSKLAVLFASPPLVLAEGGPLLACLFYFVDASREYEDFFVSRRRSIGSKYIDEIKVGREE